MSVPLGMSFEDRFKGGISDHYVMSKANKYEVCMYVGTYYLKMCKTKDSEIWNYYVLYLFKNRAQAISRKFSEIQKYRYTLNQLHDLEPYFGIDTKIIELVSTYLS